MAQSRLNSALEEGFLTLPEGDIVVIRPPSGMDLSALPRARVRISQGFRPDRDYWQSLGYEVGESSAPAGMAMVVVPRSKALARALVAEAATLAPVVVVDGQKTDGTDSLFNDLRRRFGPLSSITQAHGRLFRFDAAKADLNDWRAPPPAPGPQGFVTRGGVFSEDGIDPGSALLAETLPAKLGPRVADLGAGWGFLASAVLERAGVERVDLIEAEALALDCARINVTDPRARFHWADAMTHVPATAYDTVVTNPPFHTGRAAEPGLGRAFIVAAAGMLAPSGTLWLVANRHLPYEAALKERFVSVEEAAGTAAFKVFRATRPLAPGKTLSRSRTRT